MSSGVDSTTGYRHPGCLVELILWWRDTDVISQNSLQWRYIIIKIHHGVHQCTRNIVILRYTARTMVGYPCASINIFTNSTSWTNRHKWREIWFKQSQCTYYARRRNVYAWHEMADVPSSGQPATKHAVVDCHFKTWLGYFNMAATRIPDRCRHAARACEAQTIADP